MCIRFSHESQNSNFTIFDHDVTITFNPLISNFRNVEHDFNKFFDWHNSCPEEQSLPDTFDRSYGSKTVFCPYLVMWWPWSLDLKFLEMNNTAAVSLFHWQKLAPGTLWLQNCNFDHIRSCDELNLWPLNLKFSKMLKTAPTSLFGWIKFLPGSLKWSYNAKTEFWLIIVLMETLTFGLWISNC